MGRKHTIKLMQCGNATFMMQNVDYRRRQVHVKGNDAEARSYLLHLTFVFLLETRQFFDDLCVKHNVDCSSPRTTTRLLDKVSIIS